jgi:hypothetical protein
MKLIETDHVRLTATKKKFSWLELAAWIALIVSLSWLWKKN